MPRENVDVVLRFYERFNRGDFSGPEAAATAREMFDPKVELRQLEEIAGARGTFHGYAGLVASQRELTDALAGLAFRPERRVERGDSVAFIVRAEGIGRKSGIPVDIRIGHLWELRARRAVRWIVYRRPEEAIEAVGRRE